MTTETTTKPGVPLLDDEWSRFVELQADYNELRDERDSLGAELSAKYPTGFTGNGVPGDFESLEMDYSDADRDFRDWLASDDGREFRALRERPKAGEA